MTADRGAKALAALMLLGAFLLFSDYGVTWDEAVEHGYWHRGPRTLNFWIGGFASYDAPFATGHNPFTFFVYYVLHHALDAIGVAPPLQNLLQRRTRLPVRQRRGPRPKPVRLRDREQIHAL